MSWSCPGCGAVNGDRADWCYCCLLLRETAEDIHEQQELFLNGEGDDE